MMYNIDDAIEQRAGLSAAVDAADPRDAHLTRQEIHRVRSLMKRRRYYAGDQYDEANEEKAKAESVVHVVDLPEHMKKHAYSTQIQESVDFIASQLAEKFSVTADDTSVEEILLKALTSSPDLAAGDDAEDMSVTNVLRDGLTAGDTPVYVRWDAVEGTAWFEFWESEAVEFRYQDRDRHTLEKVIVTEIRWAESAGSVVEKVQSTTYSMVGGECVREVTQDSVPVDGEERTYLGLPFIPWGLLRASKKKIRGTRGESTITDQAMAAADRYNSMEQTSFLIGRYNSHGNLVVVGDAADLKARTDAAVHKDVADVLTFPGGTNAFALTLPTDPRMIEHQRMVLLDSLYGTFGLARLDPQTVQSMGQVSGYALEILNRKSDGTFSQIGKQWMRDMRSLLNLALDVTAYKATEEADLTPEAETAMTYDQGPAGGDMPVDMEAMAVAVLARMQAIDPNTVFENRTIDIRMGNGYIVDDVMIREDFVAGLISLDEALRLRGYTDVKIGEIKKELKDAKPAPPEVSLTPQALAAAQAALDASKAQALAATAGQSADMTGPQQPGVGSGTGTQAGSTLNNATPDQGSTP